MSRVSKKQAEPKPSPQRYADWNDFPRRKDDQGRWLCRGCGKVLSGRRTAWCSKECEREVDIRCSGHGVRRALWHRDKSICSSCGRDTNAIRRELRHLRKTLSRSEWQAELKHRQLTSHEAYGTLWEAHHVVPVEEGGGGCGVEGYETLCIWCHKEESAKQAQR